MRLTLRTLLAHRDGILPNSSCDDIEQQIRENAVAENLEKRVRYVISRAGMSSPKVNGRGLANDPNSVAEFLDNTLRTDKIANFEKICLQSDIHLSEVAACHEILAQILQDVHVLEKLKKGEYEQLKQKIHHELASEFNRQEKAEAKENAAIVQAAIGSAPHLAESIQKVVPLQGNEWKKNYKRVPTWSFALLAFLLLVLSGGVLVWKVLGETKRFTAHVNLQGQLGAEQKKVDTEDRRSQAESPINPKAVAPLKGNEKSAVLKENEASVVPEKEKRGLSNLEVKSPESDSMLTENPTDNALPSSSSIEKPHQQVPQGDALAIAARPTEIVVPNGKMESINPSASKNANVGEVENKGVLLHRILLRGRPSWVYFAPGEILSEEEDVLVPPGSTARININGTVIRLLGGTQARFTLDDDGTRRITVILGKTIIQSFSAEKRFGISAGRLHGVVTAGLKNPIAVCVEFSHQPGDDPIKVPSLMKSKIISTVGGVSWRQIPTAGVSDLAPAVFLDGIAEEGMLPSNTALVWDSKNPDVAKTSPESDVPWLSDTFVVNPNTYRAAEFLKNVLQRGSSFDQALLQMSRSHRIENRILSVATYALLGRYDELVMLLSDDTPGHKLEAIQWLDVEELTVPLALARGRNSAIKLKKAFIEHVPSQKGDMLFQMACGFDNSELESGADTKLVESLEDDELVVRRYAAKNLFEIFKPEAIDRIRYRPDGSNEMREKGIRWWKARLDDQALRWTVPR